MKYNAFVTIRTAQSRKRKLEERDRFARDLKAGLVADAELRGIYEERISRIDEELTEYDRLRSGDVGRLSGEGVLKLGALLVQARVAHGVSLAELGERMDGEASMAPQQVGRYEDEGWRRAGLWRLRQAADALGLRVRLEVELGPLKGPPEGNGG